MLDNLLHQVQLHQTMDSEILSRIMGIHPRMIRSMLATLAEMGYLREMSTCTDSHCQGCPISSSCSNTGEKVRLWKITGPEKA